MLIGRNWKIESDSMNVTLFKRGVSKKSGKETWRGEGYFGTIKEALHELVNLEIRQTGLTDLKTINNKIEELHELIDSLKEEEK